MAGFAGLTAWLRVEWSLVLLWLLILTAAVLGGCSVVQAWVILILGACLMITEMVNTAIERLCNLLEPNYNTEVKAIKDVCAGAVLVSGLALIVVGSWIILDLGSRLIE